MRSILVDAEAKSSRMRARRRFAFALRVLTLGLVMAAAATAQVPGFMNFQGKLLDTSNNPRNGTFSLTFRIFNVATGGSALWSETQGSVSVTNGVFAVQLGAVTPIPASTFSGPSYLEVQVGSEVGSPRQQLASSPFAFVAQSANTLALGNTSYVQVTGTLQSGATFYVSSGTVSGPLTVGGQIIAGSGSYAITTAAGLVDAAKLTGALPSGQLSGTYSNAVTLNNAGNVFAGDGSALRNVAAVDLVPGDTNYIQNRATLQPGSVMYVASGTVGGNFTATGTVVLGGSAGVNDVTVAGNLKVNNNLTAAGSGPQILGGNVQVTGNGLVDSGGTTRISLGAPNVLNGGLKTLSGDQLVISTNIAVSGATNNGDHYIAFPFSAGGTIAARNVVVISGANSVGTTATLGDARVLGVAINSATLGQTVYVAILGVVTGVTVDGAVNPGDPVGASATAGRATDGPVNLGNGIGNGIIGRALNGATAAGQQITIVLTQFNF